ncbi:hypothetical protein FRB93_013170 [Tulasnella sp. JGI-2019a]|nr:hypothetical protein FRB93_013170 [Tulasnella sp. JGI-2019a]
MSETALWFLDKTQEIVIVLTAVAILYTRFSPGALYFTTGAVAASRVAKVLKLILRQQRPQNARKSWTYGMPSTHSTVIIYYATYIPLASLYLEPEVPYSSLPRLLPLAIVVPWAATIACSRVWLGHHTFGQVAAGSAAGVICGLGWFWWWNHGAEELAGEITSLVLERVLPWVAPK